MLTSLSLKNCLYTSLLGAGVNKLTIIKTNTDNPAAGYVSSCRKGFKLLNQLQFGRKYVQIIVILAPVNIEATAPSLVALFHKNAARKAGVNDAP